MFTASIIVVSLWFFLTQPRHEIQSPQNTLQNRLTTKPRFCRHCVLGGNWHRKSAPGNTEWITNKGRKGCSSNPCCLNLLYLLCLWALSFHSHQFAGTRKRILRRENVSASFISPTVCCAHQPLSSSFSLSCCFMLHTTRAQFQNPLCEAFSKSPGKKEIPTAFIPLSMQFTSFMSWFPMLSPLQNYHSLEGTNHIFVPNTEKPPVMYFEWL